LDNSEIEENEEIDEINNELPSCEVFANSKMICGLFIIFNKLEGCTECI